MPRWLNFMNRAKSVFVSETECTLVVTNDHDQASLCIQLARKWTIIADWQHSDVRRGPEAHFTFCSWKASCGRIMQWLETPCIAPLSYCVNSQLEINVVFQFPRWWRTFLLWYQDLNLQHLCKDQSDLTQSKQCQLTEFTTSFAESNKSQTFSHSSCLPGVISVTILAVRRSDQSTFVKPTLPRAFWVWFTVSRSCAFPIRTSDPSQTLKLQPVFLHTTDQSKTKFAPANKNKKKRAPTKRRKLNVRKNFVMQRELCGKQAWKRRGEKTYR